MEASEGGKIPSVCDTSPCLSQVKAGISEPALRFALYEPVEFIRHFLVDKLEFSKARLCPKTRGPCLSLNFVHVSVLLCCCVSFVPPPLSSPTRVD